jgi:hypothetical protein
MATTKKAPKPRDRDRKLLAEEIIELRSEGKGWPEIKTLTGVKGPATGRRLMREFGGEAAIVKQKRGRRKSKPAAKSTAKATADQSE